ncbi:hypothetical protein ACXN5S_15525 [Pseudoroseicyclus sp. H15]
MSETRFRMRGELNAALPVIEAAPRDEGAVEMLVLRPEPAQREVVDRLSLTVEDGVIGDYWAKGYEVDGVRVEPNRAMQVAIMPMRGLAALAGPRDNWALAGDNIIADIDMSPEVMPPGTRLAVGTAELEISTEPHVGCNFFMQRYGHEACVWVNIGRGRELRLRGLYACVTKSGEVELGDKLRVLG